MRIVQTTTNDYYRIFGSYKGVFSYKSWLTWFVVVSMSSFCISIFWLVGVFKLESYFGYCNVGDGMQKAVALSLALITLFSWLKVSFRKDDLVRQRAHSVIDTEESTLWKLEKLWLEKYLPYKQSEYLALAEQIDKSIYLREKYKCAGSLSGKDFLELIFSNESKPRVLAMLLMSFASVITLSIRSGADINTVFKFYDNVSWEELAMIFLFFPIIFYVAFLEVKFVVVMLLLGLERVFERGGGRSAFSRRKTKIFINVLVRLFAFEKPRVKLTRK